MLNKSSFLTILAFWEQALGVDHKREFDFSDNSWIDLPYFRE